MSEQVLLAIDRSQFEDIEGLSLSLCEPAKDPDNPILRRDEPAGPDAHLAHFNGTILRDGGRYRLWYAAASAPPGRDQQRWPLRAAYAESPDGRTWHKPRLGLRPFRGSRDNNLVAGLPDNSECIDILREADGTYRAVVMRINGLREEHLDPVLRKGARSGIPKPAFMGIAHSEDGLRWSFREPERPAILEKLETARLLKIGDLYILNGQQTSPWALNPRHGGRAVGFFASRDLVTWEKLPVSYEHQDVQTHVGIAPLACYSGTWVGLVGRFQSAFETPDQHFELALVVSRDGVHWTEPVPCTPFIRRGPVGAWDFGGVLQGKGLIEQGDEALLYYGGNDHGNSARFAHTAIGRVRFPVHRYGYLGLHVAWGFFEDRPQPREGTCTTRLLDPPEDTRAVSVALNAANLGEDRVLRAELVDEAGRTIEGCARGDCVPLARDGVRVPVVWRGREVVERTGAIRVRVHLRGGRFREESPRLYAVRVEWKT